MILALALGLFSDNIPITANLWIMLFMVLFGLIVGLLNIQHKEMTEFLIASIALVVIYPAITSISALISKFILGAGAFLQQMFTYMVIFIIPAVLIVAVKVIVELAETR
ncbi:MAG: hypothetical protein N3D84_03340 [Candidatus Woesearchaeota archaeon]|nr:hypothetical protein [Candidatus Woesearchaeota archaeon]